jgi:hypothetical protein
MNRYGSVTTAGRVLDKFKLDYTGTVLTTISEDWHWDGGTRLVTKLETWRLPDPRSASPTGILKLGALELGQGESLRATRFDGDRVYVVTFFRIGASARRRKRRCARLVHLHRTVGRSAGVAGRGDQSRGGVALRRC